MERCSRNTLIIITNIIIIIIVVVIIIIIIIIIISVNDGSQNKKKGVVAVCLTSQQHASVSQGRICSDNFTCCHAEIEVADPAFHLTQSQYTDTGPTSPSADPITPGRVATGVPMFKSQV